MPVYDYKGLSAAGDAKTGIIDADSPREARIKLRAQNVLVTNITERSAAAKRDRKKEKILDFSKGLKGKNEVPMYTRQLATLLNAGIPLAQAMSALIEQCQIPDLEAAFRDIREKLTQGHSFAESLSYHPHYFADLYVNMVKAGEASGSLDRVLHRLADYLQRQARIRNRIAAALAYPIVMIMVGVVIVIILMAFVVPKVLAVVERTGQSIPLPTQILKSSADFLGSYWYIPAFGILALALIHRWGMRNEEYRYRKDKFMLRLPVLGDLFRKTAVSRFAVSMSTLLKSGVPVLEALRIVKDIVDNQVLARVLDTVQKRIVEGTDISTPIKRSGVFPPVVGYMIAVGEQSGQLEDMLDQVATAYDEEIEVQTQKVTSLMEPLIIVAMAVVVGFIVISVMLPILKISDVDTVRRR
ncbi:MAG: type II secretion system inner membrane protein GspF [Planctomycetota bacterium]|nr:type II secretion system inner membrane protein GspF [Planctomycetota bacterium]